ncbi:hypothetical protein GSI_00684 [Ganoderma sinense ZZ0214-1]|uniref:VWFA domain-containing protein n=1 Tax=Ganoderma sinense ZZ0214-1 TaxID=1077348 RepID=A0A2G8STD7_9APHY|nr:hypothetical protein GSI_00684 [Ganoderma sinense ZZ0214-1]
MVTKPVKVVSSMGEQSVGKSFALNHLVDTSFAGSAMRTMEGVWMSVTPTDQALIVALDFEGVHSIERSAQEDSLLVLFNTAISNLVLFHNNFTLSRDITGLFQSFQSSASVLDPEANPMLFQSTLVIIIKDVAPHDTNDIQKRFKSRFHLKFQQIVQAEQAMNFISRLHRDHVDIVPWPLLGSRQFYTLFKAIKKSLDEQAVTHHGGAIFLQTMKTLMAKLKINDWGAMSQTLAAHRVHLLLSLLPKAMAFGATEIIPDYEPLVDFDMASVIDIRDTRSQFYLGETGPQGQPAGCDVALQMLCQSCHTYGDRFSQADTDWKRDLQAFLDDSDTVDMWVEHVRAWISVNTLKFGSDQSEVQQLFRTFNSAVIDLKASIWLCGAQCSLCNLGCVLSRHHEGSHSCQTDHHCVRMCQFEGAEHGNTEPCGLPYVLYISFMLSVVLNSKCHSAGHPGSHLCDVTAHLCGQRCKLIGKKGCQEACIKMVNHEDGDHMCSMSTHECGMVRDVSQLYYVHAHGSFSCAVWQVYACSTDIHSLVMDNVGFLGLQSSTSFSSHFAPLIANSADVFALIMITSTVCNLTLFICAGHSQQEHDTSHGSMSKTKWAVDGGERTVLEVGGRKFGMNDDGAPMLCSMYCHSMGRHAHIDWCRTNDPNCGGPEHEHIVAPMQPNPRKPKDWITHGLYWRQTGFSSLVSNLEQFIHLSNQTRILKKIKPTSQNECVTGQNMIAQPILEPSHPIARFLSFTAASLSTRNPAVLRQVFHVIFAIDRSGSMGINDRRPLDNTPTTQLIRGSHNNRLGAVYSSLHGFWEARHRAVMVNGGTARRNAYSVILFDHTISTAITHDFTSTPTQLLDTVLRYQADGGTDFTLAIGMAQSCLERHWSTER